MSNDQNLFLFEAVQYRTLLDRHVEALEELLGKRRDKRDRMRFMETPEERVPAEGFDASVLSDELAKLKVKRMRLNREIQKANFSTEFDFEGESTCIADALELRKCIVEELATVKERLVGSAYCGVIHKEKRDIIVENDHKFPETYDRFKGLLKRQRLLEQLIHRCNHEVTVDFRWEG